MQKKAIVSLFSKNSASNNRLFLTISKANFHSSKVTNVEVSFFSS